MPVNSLVVVDPSLDLPVGHHFQASVEIARSSEELGFKCVFLASTLCDSDAFQTFGCDVRPTFTIGTYVQPYQADVELERFLNSGEELAAEYAAAAFPDGAYVLMHTSSPWHLRALAARVEGVRDVQVAIGLMLQPPFWTKDAGTSERLKAMTQEALSRLASLNCFVYGETGDLSGAGTLWQPMSERSMAHVDALVQRVAREPRSRPIRFGYFGQPRAQKGLDLLLELLERRLLDDVGGVSLEFFLPPGHSDLVDRINCGSSVARASSALRTNERYLEEMMSVDVVLCAYDPARYDQQMSGIVTEAALLGKPTVVSNGTALHRFLDRYSPGSYLAVAFDVIAVLGAFTQSPDLWEQRQIKALASRSAIRELKRARRFFGAAFGIALD